MKTNLSKKQLDFLIHWANECIRLENPHYSIQVIKTDGKAPFCISENFAPELKSKEECEEWVSFFSGMCKDGILVLTKGLDRRVDIYTFKSQNAIDSILKLKQ